MESSDSIYVCTRKQIEERLNITALTVGEKCVSLYLKTFGEKKGFYCEIQSPWFKDLGSSRF